MKEGPHTGGDYTVRSGSPHNRQLKLNLIHLNGVYQASTLMRNPAAIASGARATARQSMAPISAR